MLKSPIMVFSSLQSISSLGWLVMIAHTVTKDWDGWAGIS